jgi:protein-glucosylgalactosylhydroxylysine glucosidase
MDSFDDELTYIFLKVLKRNPTKDEITTYRFKFFNQQQTFIQIEQLLRESVEYLELNFEHSSEHQRSIYGMNIHTFEMKNIEPKNYKGVQLTNGKTGVITSPYVNKNASTFITTLHDLNQVSKHNSNVLETFDYSGLNFFETSEHNVRVENHVQTLNTYTACFTNTYDLIYVTTVGQTYTLNIEHNMRSLRQFPYCFLHSYKITNKTGVNIEEEIPIYHLLRKPDNLREDVEYFNNKVDDELLFSASSTDINNNIQVVCCSSYIYDKTNSEHIGHNINNGIAYNLFKITRLNTSQTFEFNIFTGTMTTLDFPEPKHELKRTLTAIMRLNTTTKLITTHNTLWAKLWSSDINFEGKVTNNLEKSKKLENLRKNVKYSLFNIFSMMRDDVSSDFNPLKINGVDSTGDIFWNSDLFLIPVLIILKSSYAKTLIDNRFNQLETAKALALSYGFKGAKYPHDKDVFGYNDIYWNTSVTIYVFNTGLVSVNSWNYFRVSQDHEWLREKGIKLFTSVADFFTSILDSEYNIPNTFSLNNEDSKNNIMTMYFAALSIKIAIESYYEVNYKIKKEWKTAYLNIIKHIETLVEGIEINEGTYKNIIKLHTDFDGVKKYEVSEILLLFTSYHSKLLFSLIPSIKVNDFIRSNLDYHESIVNRDLDLNKILIATLYAKRAQTYSDTQDDDLLGFENYLSNLFNEMETPWGGCPRNEGLIFIILFGLSEFTVTGSINFDRFYTERYGVKSKTGYVLPDYIHKMIVTINSTRVDTATYTINNIK